MSQTSCRDGLAQRLGSRPARSLSDSYRDNWMKVGLPEAEVVQLLGLVETIYGIPAGLLRPEDPIELLTGPVPARNWWRDHFHDLIGGDNERSLGDELVLKLRAHSIESHVTTITNIDALVKAWCGLVPSP